MYSVVVADDEPLMADGLCEMLAGIEGPPFELHRFYSGERAEAFARQNSVDILITDLRMPVTDGHELHRVVHEYWPHARVIFLTGYNDFDDVQTAMRDHAADYILKTEDDDTLRCAFRSALEALERDATDRLALAEAEHLRRLSLPVLRHALLSDLMTGAMSRDTLASGLSEYQIPLEPRTSVLPLVIRIDRPADPPSGVDRHKLHARVEEMISLFFDRVDVITAPYAPLEIGCLLTDRPASGRVESSHPPDDVHGTTAPDGPGAEDSLVRYANQNAVILQRLAARQHDIRLSAAIARSLVAVEDCGAVFEQLRGVLHSMYRIQPAVIVSPGEAPAGDSSVGDDGWTRATELLGRLRAAIDGGSVELVRDIMHELEEILEQSRSMTAPRRMEVWLRLASDVVGYLNENDLFESISERADLGALFGPDPTQPLSNVVREAADICEQAMEAHRASVHDFGERVAKAAVAYIRTHYADDLSLTSIADHFHFNPSYFSRLFKRHTGTTVGECIRSTRLGAARERLLYTTLRIKEIATETGFNTVSYFIGNFKRHYGTTPQRFRDAARDPSPKPTPPRAEPSAQSPPSTPR